MGPCSLPPRSTQTREVELPEPLCDFFGRPLHLGERVVVEHGHDELRNVRRVALGVRAPERPRRHRVLDLRQQVAERADRNGDLRRILLLEPPVLARDEARRRDLCTVAVRRPSRWSRKNGGARSGPSSRRPGCAGHRRTPRSGPRSRPAAAGPCQQSGGRRSDGATPASFTSSWVVKVPGPLAAIETPSRVRRWPEPAGASVAIGTSARR